MKDKIVDKFLEKALKYIETLEQLGSDEVPLYIKELLEFEAYSCGVWGWIGATVAAILFLLCVIFIFCAIIDDWNAGGLACGAVFWLSLSVVSGLQSVDCFMDVHKIKTAPRVYIIDYIKRSTQK